MNYEFGNQIPKYQIRNLSFANILFFKTIFDNKVNILVTKTVF